MINLLFHSLHIVIILSSLLLWLFKELVIVHLGLQAIILFSWLVIGPIVSRPGACFLTELHKKLGLAQGAESPHSYIVYLCQKLGYQGRDYKKIDNITFTVFAICTVFSLIRFSFNF